MKKNYKDSIFSHSLLHFFLNLGIRFSFLCKVLWDTHNNKYLEKLDYEHAHQIICVCMCDAMHWASLWNTRYVNTLSIFNFTAVVVIIASRQNHHHFSSFLFSVWFFVFLFYIFKFKRNFIECARSSK